VYSFSAPMTLEQLCWLENPENELRELPEGTLVVMRSSGVKINLAKLLPSQPGVADTRFQRLPDFRVLTVSQMVGRKAQFALLG